jgi:hypothetical protein
MANELDTLETKYRMLVKLACLVALITIVGIDAVVKDFEAPTEVELGLVAAVAGLEIKEKTHKLKKKKKKK